MQYGSRVHTNLQPQVITLHHRAAICTDQSSLYRT